MFQFASYYHILNLSWLYQKTGYINTSHLLSCLDLNAKSLVYNIQIYLTIIRSRIICRVCEISMQRKYTWYLKLQCLSKPGHGSTHKFFPTCRVTSIAGRLLFLIRITQNNHSTVERLEAAPVNRIWNWNRCQWCFKLRICTVMLYWNRDNLG